MSKGKGKTPAVGAPAAPSGGEDRALLPAGHTAASWAELVEQGDGEAFVTRHVEEIITRAWELLQERAIDAAVKGHAAHRAKDSLVCALELRFLEHDLGEPDGVEDGSGCDGSGPSNTWLAGEEPARPTQDSWARGCLCVCPTDSFDLTPAPVPASAAGPVRRADATTTRGRGSGRVGGSGSGSSGSGDGSSCSSSSSPGHDRGGSAKSRLSSRTTGGGGGGGGRSTKAPEDTSLSGPRPTPPASALTATAAAARKRSGSHRKPAAAASAASAASAPSSASQCKGKKTGAGGRQGATITKVAEATIDPHAASSPGRQRRLPRPPPGHPATTSSAAQDPRVRSPRAFSKYDPIPPIAAGPP